MSGTGTLLVLIAGSIPPGPLSPAESARYALEAADGLNAPLPEALRERLVAAEDDRALWQAVSPHALLEVEINPEMRVKVAAGPARARLVAGKTQAFFVRVENRCGATARLAVSVSDLAAAKAGEPDWIDVEIADAPGSSDRLSGAPLEYKLILCRAALPGRREARLGLDAGQGTQDLGFRGVTDILFHVRPASDPSPGD